MLSGENAVLQELDLRWNHIRTKGAQDLAKGVKVGSSRSCSKSFKLLNLNSNIV